MSLDKCLPLLAACLVVGSMLCTFTGCGDDVAIRTYTVSRELPDAFSETDRILGAIVQADESAWFFKMNGPTELLDEVREPFRQWIGSLRFEDGTPNWDLPDGWQRNPGTSLRFATVVAPAGDSSVEASVSKLPGSDDWSQLLTDNVNRWRGQLGQEPIEDVMAEVEQIELADHAHDAFLVDITGTKQQGGRMAPPMMSSQPPATQTTAAPSPQPSGLDFDAPESWQRGPGGVMRLASFIAGEDDKKVEITVIRAGGDEEGNIRRWLGQIRSDVTDELVNQTIEEATEVVRPGDASDGKLYLLPGENDRAIYAVVFPEPSGISLFVKMTGHSETADAEKDAFVQFAESIREKT